MSAKTRVESGKGYMRPKTSEIKQSFNRPTMSATNKNKISLHELEKTFMDNQKNMIELYLKGDKVDQNIINKDFTSYTLEKAQDLAKMKYEMRKNKEFLHEKDRNFVNKRVSYLCRPKSSILLQGKSQNKNLIEEKTSTKPSKNSILSADPTKIVKRVVIKHLSVKEKKKKKKLKLTKEQLKS